VKVSQWFGEVIRKRRLELNLTQEAVARRAKVAAQYITHLETNRRRPSEKVVINIARALGLDSVELFFLANPKAKAVLFGKPKAKPDSAWKEFSTDQRTRKFHNITDDEMDFLSRVAMVVMCGLLTISFSS
jgi:transcriptional regulator with XRE-family HTH domain